MATNGRRRTKGAGSIIHRKDGSWEFRREVGRDPATGKRRYVSAKGRTKADARERFDAKVAEMERTGLLPGAKSPYLKDYAERWLEEYRLNVKPTTYRTRAGRIHACMEVIGCIRLTELTPDHIRQCMRVLSKRLAPSTLKDHFVSLKMMLDQAELEELIPVDPCRRVKPPRVEPTETRILSPDQPKQLIEAVPNRGAKRRGPALTVDVDESWMLLFELAFAAGMREGERYALMPYELEQRDGVPGINVQQQIQQYGKPEDAVIPAWLKAEHLYGILWLTTPKTHAAHRFVPISTSLWQRLWARIKRLDIGPRCISSSRCFVFSHVFFSGLGSCMHFPYFSGCAEVFLPNMRASLTRRLWPVNSRSRPWCTMRSMIAAASLSSAKTVPHLLNSMFVVNMMLRLS